MCNPIARAWKLTDDYWDLFNSILSITEIIFLVSNVGFLTDGIQDCTEQMTITLESIKLKNPYCVRGQPVFWTIRNCRCGSVVYHLTQRIVHCPSEWINWHTVFMVVYWGGILLSFFWEDDLGRIKKVIYLIQQRLIPWSQKDMPPLTHPDLLMILRKVLLLEIVYDESEKSLVNETLEVFRKQTWRFCHRWWTWKLRHHLFRILQGDRKCYTAIDSFRKAIHISAQMSLEKSKREPSMSYSKQRLRRLRFTPLHTASLFP
jgi:hypothetical protein